MTIEPLPDIDDAAPLTFAYDDVSLAGYAWWAEDVDVAPVFLLLHGWGEDGSTLAPLARRIRNRGWHAVSISMRGWRGSTGVDDYGLSASKDIGRVLAWIRQQPSAGQTILLGFSMGGVMAGLAAVDQTELAGVVVVGAPCHLPTLYAETAFGGVRRYFDAVLQPQQWNESSPLTHAAAIGDPMLVVTGGRDTKCPPEQGRRMAGAVPHGRLLHIPGMDHHPMPDEWERILDAAAHFIGLRRESSPGALTGGPFVLPASSLGWEEQPPGEKRTAQRSPKEA